jgi:hypothetical protein
MFAGMTGAVLTVAGFFLLCLLVRNRRIVHDMAVCYLTPDREDAFFFATCECGWLGDPSDDPGRSVRRSEETNTQGAA